MSTGERTETSYAAGTVVTSDYLPWARVLSKSFLEHNPGAAFTVLVLDEPSPDQLRDTDRFQLVSPRTSRSTRSPTSGWPRSTTASSFRAR